MSDSDLISKNIPPKHAAQEPSISSQKAISNSSSEVQTPDIPQVEKPVTGAEAKVVFDAIEKAVKALKQGDGSVKELEKLLKQYPEFTESAAILMEDSLSSGSDSIEQALLRISVSKSQEASETFRELAQKLQTEGEVIQKSHELISSVDAKNTEQQSVADASTLPRALKESIALGTREGAETLDSLSKEIRQFLKQVQDFEPVDIAIKKIDEVVKVLENKTSSASNDLKSALLDLKKVILESESDNIDGAKTARAFKSAIASSKQALESILPELKPDEQRLVKSAVKEIVSHARNIALEKAAIEKVKSDADSLIKELESLPKGQTPTFDPQILRVLAEIPTVSEKLFHQQTAEVLKVLEQHVAKSDHAKETLESAFKEIDSAESVEQVKRTLLKLLDAVSKKANSSEVRVYKFSNESLLEINRADVQPAIIKPVAVHETLLQIKHDLANLKESLPDLKIEAKPDLPELSIRHRVLLRSLEGLLETAITEFDHISKQQTEVSSEELLQKLDKFISGFEKVISRSAKDLVAAGVDAPALKDLLSRFKAMPTKLREGLSSADISLDKLKDMLSVLKQDLLSVLEETAPVAKNSLSNIQTQLLESLNKEIELSINSIRIKSDVVTSPDKIPLIEMSSGRIQATENIDLDNIFKAMKQEVNQLKTRLGDQPLLQNIQDLIKDIELQPEKADLQRIVATELIKELNTLLRQSNDKSSLGGLFEQLQEASKQKSGLEQILSDDKSQSLESGVRALEKILHSQVFRAASGSSIQQDFQILLDIISKVQTNSSGARSAIEQGIAESIKLLSGQLEQAMSGDAKKQQEVLASFVSSVRSKVGKFSTNDKTQSQREKTLKTLQSLENIVKGQEALLKMAPLLEASGDAVFVLFPMIIQGFMSRIELTYYNSEVDDNPGGKNKGNRKGLQSSEIKLDLPDIGAVAVRFSHSKTEVICDLQFEKEDVATFVKKRLPILRRSLLNAGFDNLDCTVSVGVVESVAPDWIGKFRQPGIIA